MEKRDNSTIRVGGYHTSIELADYDLYGQAAPKPRGIWGFSVLFNGTIKADPSGRPVDSIEVLEGLSLYLSDEIDRLKAEIDEDSGHETAARSLKAVHETAVHMGTTGGAALTASDVVKIVRDELNKLFGVRR